MLIQNTIKKFIFASLFFMGFEANASFEGEMYFSPQWGGTNFNETGGTNYEHKRSWEFSYNSGYSLGVKLGLNAGKLITLGVGAEYGWKEEAIDKISATGSSTYDFQISRLFAGPYLLVSPGRGPMHFMFEYNPLVHSTVIFSDNDHLHPFRKGDTLKGTAVAGGIGGVVEGFLVRILWRQIDYSELKLNDVVSTLPDATYTRMKTNEFAIQIGSTF